MIFNKIDIEKYKKDFEEGLPFKHCIIDNILKDEVANEAHKELKYVIPNEKWHKYDSLIEKKYANDDWELIPQACRAILGICNTGIFINMLEDISGIKGLIPDPGLRGGGIHMILPGGKLDIHADRQVHPKLGLYRRLNVIIYMNKDWRANYGGYLEMWEKDMSKLKTKVSPIFNRMVMFETTATSFHGHPDPLKCDPGMSRNSLALYYWTKDIPEGFEANLGSTDFRARPQDTDPEAEKLREKRRTAEAIK